MPRKPTVVESKVRKIIDNLKRLGTKSRDYRGLLADAQEPLVKILDAEERKREEKVQWERWHYQGFPGGSGRRYGYGRQLAEVYARHFGREGFTPVDAVEFLATERDEFGFLPTGSFNALMRSGGYVHSLFGRGILERKPDPKRFGSIYRFTEEAWEHLFPEPAAPSQSY
ncbi:MAG: hypothetical protein HYW26_05165 [Candidatus Aenigmarchaeota archaeon]|nr:hypothetical protein [Candidatus Aenigmarchaeota archaeon]